MDLKSSELVVSRMGIGYVGFAPGHVALLWTGSSWVRLAKVVDNLWELISSRRFCSMDSRRSWRLDSSELILKMVASKSGTMVVV